MVESQAPINDLAMLCLNDLGRRIADVSGEIREGSFLFQQLSVLIQRFNTVLLAALLTKWSRTGIPAKIIF